MNDPLDKLAKDLVDGKIKLVSVRIRVCGRCIEGTLESRPKPNWMNRWVCNKCGKAVSR